MCYERWFHQHRRQADESESIWQDFERTRPLADPGPAPADTPPDPIEAEEEIAVSDR